MSTPVANAQFLRGVCAGLLFATGISAVSVIFAVLAVPSPPAESIISYLP